MLRRLFGLKPKPPTLPLEYRTQLPVGGNAITDGPASASTLSTTQTVRDVVDTDFDEVVLRSDLLTVVDVWADWCPPCEIISAYMEWLARDYGARLRVVALDADENPRIPERYTIMGLPTLLFFRGGVEVDRQVGLLSYEELQSKVETLLAQPAAEEER